MQPTVGIQSQQTALTCLGDQRALEKEVQDEGSCNSAVSV